MNPDSQSRKILLSNNKNDFSRVSGGKYHCQRNYQYSAQSPKVSPGTQCRDNTFGREKGTIREIESRETYIFAGMRSMLRDEQCASHL